MSKPPVIKFSHRYRKLGVLGNSSENHYTATLVSVHRVKLEELPHTFLQWDTDDGLYVLPKRGKYLLLLFLSHGGLFTTLRADFPERKFNYYSSLVGKEFLVDFQSDSTSSPQF